jgi:hypothetical protein
LFLYVAAPGERWDDWLEPGQLSFNAILPSIFAQAVIVVLDQSQTNRRRDYFLYQIVSASPIITCRISVFFYAAIV